jgi:mannitol-1-phosphate 5-dehydrogenase
VVNLHSGVAEKLAAEGIHHASESEGIADAIQRADLLFTAVGATHLEEWAKAHRGMILDRLESGNIDLILCENHPAPAIAVGKALCIESKDGRFERLGIVQAQVLRSCIEPTEEQIINFGPLTVQIQDHWTLPMDRDSSRCPDHLYSIAGFEPKPAFAIELTRKLYTYNAINAAVCYLGAYSGHQWLADAANDQLIAIVAEGVGREASAALIAEYGFDIEEQRDWCTRALAKYRDRAIRDPIERNARDPIRKLGRFERILGPIHLCLDHNIAWPHLEDVLFAALHYREASDLSANDFAQRVKVVGTLQALKEVAPTLDERISMRMEQRLSNALK